MRDIEYRLRRGRVLVELGWIDEAEAEIGALRTERPDDLDAMSLFAKIKHIKGELGEAIRCWGHISARGSTISHVTMQLGALMHSAFVHARRPAEARAACAALAARHRGRDPTIYKVAAIAEARIAETCGDLAGARAGLERLGLERELAGDHDRLLALARVYDQLGTPDALAAAARICRHVLRDLDGRRVQNISLLSRLASFERRAGREDAARELDARFRDVVRRRMHRPTTLDFIAVAARDHLPLAQLREAHAPEPVPDDLPPREEAIASVLRGDLARASTLFARGGGRLDRQYAAELAALAGDEERATELLLSALDGTADDAPAIAWLLDRHARAPSPGIAAYWADPARRLHAATLVERSLTIAPWRAETWRRLATLHGIAGDHERAGRCATRAAALADAALRRARPIGRVLAASVYHFSGRPKGLVHELAVHRTPVARGRGGTLGADDIHGNVTPELRAAIRNTFVSVREYARAKFPDTIHDIDDHIYAYKLPKDDEPSGGLSAGLPTALAFLSVFLQRPIARTIASSGTIISEAHDVIAIGRIGEADVKVKGAYHANLRSLILPQANRSDLERSLLVPLEITREVVRYVSDLDQAVKLVFGADVFTRT